MVRDIPEEDDLMAADEQVEQTKTHEFGIAYFVPDSHDDKVSDDKYRSALAGSVVGITKDGSGHTQHFRNVFKDTHPD